MWGFFTVMNDILIPHLKHVFIMSHFKAMMVQLSFFGAYFIGSVIYFLVSVNFGDPINKIGYKNGMFLGLILSAIGSALFFPATIIQQYWLYLTALFVVGLGFVLLQITANPYVAILGHEKTASSRLNLSQGFNSFGTTIGPLIGGFLIFKYFAGDEAVRYPYLAYACIFIILAVIIKFSKLPQFKNPNDLKDAAGALKFRHLILGMIAIFVYVGGEVAIGSILISFIKEIVKLPEAEASNYVAIYWGGLMIGRFSGAISLSKIDHKLRKYILILLSTIITFLVIFFAIYIKSNININYLLPFLLIVILNYVAFIIGKSMPNRTLLVFAISAIILLVTGLFTKGYVALWSIVGIGLFNSIMWSNIFTLSIAGLGEYTSQGSSLLIMAILGGAIVPVIQGGVADSIGVHQSFIIPIACYLYIAYYGWRGYKPKKSHQT
jgi:FHS family L-fucose permease-like MFS transporter